VWIRDKGFIRLDSKHSLITALSAGFHLWTKQAAATPSERVNRRETDEAAHPS
jgi:hypothetical protein